MKIIRNPMTMGQKTKTDCAREVQSPAPSSSLIKAAKYWCEWSVNLGPHDYRSDKSGQYVSAGTQLCIVRNGSGWWTDLNQVWIGNMF